MINSYLSTKISENFPYTPTTDQQNGIETLVRFILSRKQDSLLLLTGYAGTGKTSLIGALVKTFRELKQKTILMAPTGRAAKVVAGYAGQQAFTIHKKIYRQKVFSADITNFQPAVNLHKDTLFIVDEASMISNDGIDSFVFGSGRLLDDLIQYVYSGKNCRMILSGDEAQLPPVKQPVSPALEPAVLEGFGMELYRVRLEEVVRQQEESGILYNATTIRDTLKWSKVQLFPKIRLAPYKDIIRLNGEELIEEIASAYDRDGIEETIIITRSNKRALIYNNGVRNRILYREEELSSGDRLMVARNNYFWTEKREEMDFMANGEMVEVVKVRAQHKLYGFRFADVTVRLPDYDLELDVKIILDALQTDLPAMSKEMNEKLFFTVLEDYEDIATKAEKYKKMKTNPWYNAIQVKYAYAVTCHKAQGGQWKNVFVDFGYLTQEMMGEDFYRWFYTAFTRATEKLFLVNIPDDFVES